MENSKHGNNNSTPLIGHLDQCRQSEADGAWPDKIRESTVLSNLLYSSPTCVATCKGNSSFMCPSDPVQPSLSLLGQDQPWPWASPSLWVAARLCVCNLI